MIFETEISSIGLPRRSNQILYVVSRTDTVIRTPGSRGLHLYLKVRLLPEASLFLKWWGYHWFDANKPTLPWKRSCLKEPEGEATPEARLRQRWAFYLKVRLLLEVSLFSKHMRG